MRSVYFRLQFVFCVLLSSLFLGSPAIAQTTVTAGFENGVIGEYRNNAHQPTRLNTFATLGITGAVISDTTDDGRFGGSQGNDYTVTVTFQFSDGTTSTFNAAVNWRDTQGSTVHGIGLTVSGGVDDGTSYVAASGLQKTYLLQFVSSTRVYADTASGDQGNVISGNAATTGLFDALNTYASSPPASINPSSLTSTITASPVRILADGSSTSTITVQLKDVNGNNLSAGGNTVVLSTDAGSLSAVNDNGDGTYTAVLTSSSVVETATITGTLDGLSISDTASVDFYSASSISGTVLNGGGVGLSGRTVKLFDASDLLLQTVTTGAGGIYIFNDVAPGTYKIEFTVSNSSKAKARSAVGSNNSNVVTAITVADASTDITGVDAVVIDPAGVVYDTVTRQPVAGAVVTFNYNGSLVPNSSLDQTLGGPNTQTTSADGQYSFVLNSSASDGVYTLNVTEPSGYTFQSLAIPVSSGPFNPGLGGGIVEIQPQATAPTGSDDTTYYLDFSFVVGASPATTSNGVINNHIPLDPTPSVSVTNTTDASEPSTNGVFTVNLSTASATDTVVGYSVAGTATAGTDYTALSGTVTISANTTSATISVPVIDDSLVEGDETVIITLTGVTSGTASLSSTAADLTATNTISDDDTGLNAAPVFTNQNAGSGTSYSFDYAEGSSTSDVLGQVSATDAEGDTLTFSITGGNDDGWYAIDSSTGELTLTAAGVAGLANDYEQTPNTQTLTVTVSDGTNSTTVQVALNETDVDDVPPVITGPSGSPGAAASELSVNEGQTGVTQLTADKEVTWLITGGNDQDKFEIGEDGTITFVATPDFEVPTDSDTNNTYILIVSATDAAGNISTQTITVTVLDLDDTGPVITGPSGGEGAAESAITINEGLTALTTFTANEEVTWSIDGGSDAAKFQVDPETGAIVFLVAPDYENPTDVGSNNTYVVRVKAVDAAGNVSYQTLTVTIINVDEIGQKLDEIGAQLRTSLRTYAIHGLSDMLSFNETLMRRANDDACSDPRDLSGSARANQSGGNVDLQYSRRLSECGRRHQVYVDAGLTYSNTGGNWNSRIFGGLRFETKVDEDFTIGLGALASRSSDDLAGFDRSSISDKSLQATAYGRYDLSESLRSGAFVGFGRTWYDFNLTEGDGFSLDGSMRGKRRIYGWMLSGDWTIGGTVVTTDAILSRAKEQLGNAKLSAEHLGEKRSGIVFDVGTVDVTRLSVPVTAPITLAGSSEEYGSLTRLLVSPGLLCEDNAVDSSAMRCGYQLGAKFVANDDSGRNRFYADYRWENVAGMQRSLIGLGYAYRFGGSTGLELALEADSAGANDNRALLSLRLAR